eukprot:CAMPEP_0119104316 /NCGR_PEP_ID=MMETSP1180-20130426/2555_1 /TAXON_ID=3052 ORGANISM="Chlamydomonas cf sp, Strain CCMP681" /NCGR_SAMPLE_ID=MMETSP1180 /ASSEMBLY_ACC=CAM_ASM_000741 /LENGTH=40 /DNA_ID= /DNA_START= /DNA_END= /DNA_ORIENTATION=
MTCCVRATAELKPLGHHKAYMAGGPHADPHADPHGDPQAD